jgi:tRNA pseudouridine38-40 synthase
LIVGYNGCDFSGSQKNPDIRSVEEEIEKALYKMGAIAEYNYGDLKKIAWNRATRTDKKVHALQNVFSCKVQFDKAEDEESFRGRLNALLPKDVKVFCVIRSSNRFNAKNCTSNREYSYYLPSFMLTKISDLYFGHPVIKKVQPKEGE